MKLIPSLDGADHAPSAVPAESSEANSLHQLDPSSWFVNHHSYLRNLALSKLRNPATAEDLVQETFLAAWKAREKFAGRAAERTWLTRILLNKIADFYRSRARKPTVAVSQLSTEEGSSDEILDALFLSQDSPQGMSNTPPQPSTATERAEFVALVERFLEEVPTQAAAAFRMRELQGLSTDDIVESLGITPNHLWVLIHRAKKALRKKMEAFWEGSLENSQPAPCC
ncbi:MAG: sigma-70 family RNA polymerase sigma factor [Verrucomicrobiota bacterium]